MVDRSEPDPKARSSSLSDPQALRLRVTCKYLDELLGDIEDILNESGSGTAFPRYASDISPVLRKTIEDSIDIIRAELLRIVKDIPGVQPAVPASRTIRFTLTAMDIAVEELKPRHMKRYGEVAEAAAAELNGIARDLHGLIVKLDEYLVGREGGSISAGDPDSGRNP